MYVKSILLAVAGSVCLFGQASSVPGLQALQKQVDEGIVPKASLAQAEAARSAAKDAELLNAPLGLNDLTEEQAAQLEAAAFRQLDRSKARVAQVRTLVDAGLAPAQDLASPLEQQSLAQTSYDLILQRTKLVHQMTEMARAEEQILEAPKPAEAATAAGSAPPLMERFNGDGSFTASDFRRIENAFEQTFHKALPVSAEGETAVHRAMGFDHRDRVDVAIFPDTTEGVWLRHFLEASDIPYYAFRSSIPGKATGAHIHIGPPSTRIHV
jgi:hypothetical protein